jgi:Mn-dependent DtxR family transcriptional regulator
MQLTADEEQMSPESIAQEVLDSLIDMGLVAVTETDHYTITEKGERVLERELSAYRCTEARELAEHRRDGQLRGSPRSI